MYVVNPLTNLYADFFSSQFIQLNSNNYNKLVYDAVLAYGNSLNMSKAGLGPSDVLRKLNITGLSVS